MNRAIDALATPGGYASGSFPGHAPAGNSDPVRPLVSVPIKGGCTVNGGPRA